MLIKVSGNYTLQPNAEWQTFNLQDVYLVCDTSSAPVNIYLPKISDLDGFLNVRIYVSDFTGNSAVNNITIVCPIGNTINGGGGVIIDNPLGSVVLMITSRTQWIGLDSHTFTSTAYQTVEDEGTPLIQRTALNFVGNGVSVSDVGGKTTVSIPYVPSTKYFGSFYDTTTQTTTQNTPTAMKLNTTDFTNGVSVINDAFSKPTIIKVANAGVYNLQFSAQLYRTSGGNQKDIDIWFRLNGLNVPNSNTRITFANNSTFLVASWNFLFDLNDDDEVQIMYAVEETTIQLVYEGENLSIPHPAIPSVIVTITQV